MGGGKLMKPVIAGVVALLLLALIVYVFLQSWVAGLVLLGGLLVALLIVGVFVAIVAGRRRRRAQAFEDELAASAAGTGGVGGAAAKARVDELRRRFQEGVETFRKHGKSVYSVPWYVIVGEPGAGKTEAIRHSMIGFPPGLQDELQGSGGTLNMDWWFSNHAVILDTAGRLMFEEGAGKTSQEWREFLKLLTKARPNCPLNGVMLCIPADSLIKDPIDEVDTKAASIASKLALIQRELDVRFPVFIVVTKADLINGFREFFDSVDDPQLQHQMVGWSNPAPLDEPFRADRVEDHLLEMQDRLIKRRMGLLYDPAARERGTRTSEVDALYAFPEAMVNLAPNLERYLETIFRGGEWAQQPLFLRGIYFASAMQEGSALDADLAKAMGVSVDQLPEGSIWERQRSYFLRDLFVEKMFRERGLVTRASNAMKLKARRRLAMRAFVGVAAVLLIGLTFFGYRSLRQSIAGPKDFWQSAARSFGGPVDAPQYPVLVSGWDGPRTDTQLSYAGDDDVSGMGDAEKVSEAPAAALKAAQTRIRVSPVFWVASRLSAGSTSGDLFREQRQEAARVIFTNAALEPLARRALDTLSSPDRASFDEPGVRALAELIKLYRSNTVDPPTVDLSAIGAFVLRDEVLSADEREAAAMAPEAAAVARLNEDIAPVQATFDALVELGDGWPRSHLEAVIGPPGLERKLRRSVGNVATSAVRALEAGASSEDGPLAVAQRYQAALVAYREAEDRLLDAYAPKAGGEARTTADFWGEQVPRLERMAETLDELSLLLGERSFSEWYEQQVAEAASGERAKIEALKQSLGTVTAVGYRAKAQASAALGRDEPEGMNTLEEMYHTLTRAEGQLDQLEQASVGDREALIRLHEDLLRQTARGGRGYRERLALYRATEEVRSAGVQLERFVDLIVTRETVNEGIENQTRVNTESKTGVPSARMDRGADAGNAVLRMAGDARVRQLYDKAEQLPDVPRTALAVKQAVANTAEARGLTPEAAPDLPLAEVTAVGGRLDPGFVPEAATAVLELMGGVESRTRNTSLAGQMKAARDAYARDYIRYWSRLLEDQSVIRLEPIETWAAFQEAVGQIRPGQVNAQLQTLLQTRLTALASLPLTSPEMQWDGTLAGDRDKAVRELAQMREALGAGAIEAWQTAWRGLDRDPARAKSALLNQPHAVFEQTFIVPVGRGVALGLEYWEPLTMAGLRSLAGAGKDEAQLALQRLLTEWNRFPLATLTPGTDLSSLAPGQGALTEDQVRQAKRDLDLAGVAGVGGEGGVLSYAESEVGHESYVVSGAPTLNALLTQMRGDKIRGEDQDYLKKVSAMMAAIGGGPQTVEVRWVRSVPDRPISSTFRAVRAYQGGGALGTGKATFASGSLGEASLPGGPIELRFWLGENEAAPEQAWAARAGGPWAALAMVQGLGGTTSDGGTTWLVRVAEPGGSAGELEFVFQRPLPPKAEWPTR